MEETTNKVVKILFRFFSEILDRDAVETLWAITVNETLGHYRIDSIPFYLPGIATDDIVHAEYDEENILTYSYLVSASGNSNVWVVIVDEETDIDDVRDIFDELGCPSETLSNRYFSMEIKAETNYIFIKDKLNELRAEGLIEYSESCISSNHQSL
jgi:hypothetical protein